MARRARGKTMTLEGADDVLEALRKIGSRASGLTLRKAAGAGAQIIADEARRLAPRDSGDLAEGITIEYKDNSLRGGRAQVDIGPGRAEFYGRMVELGTEKMAAQPYLRPSIESKQREAAAAVRAVLRDALRELLD